MGKVTKEKFKTYQNVFDEFTNRNLFKLCSQGHFEGLKSPIQIGKEANVFSAQKKDGSLVIVKIYRLETVDFKRMYDYIKQDSRFPNLKRARRQIIFSWTQREFRNLMKAREAGVRVPMPITFKDNLIVMEHIGVREPAPQLKDSYPNDPTAFFDSIINYVKILWKAGLVHGDLSHFNILNDNEDVVFIDFSQGLATDAMTAKEYLQRDLLNVCNFFKKIGLEKDPKEIFEEVIGL